MNKRTVVATSILLSVLIVGIVAYLNISKDDKNLSDQQIKDKYCHVTTEVRKTDVYCQNPELYRQHLREKTVILE